MAGILGDMSHDTSPLPWYTSPKQLPIFVLNQLETGNESWETLDCPDLYQCWNSPNKRAELEFLLPEFGTSGTSGTSGQLNLFIQVSQFLMYF